MNKSISIRTMITSVLATMALFLLLIGAMAVLAVRDSDAKLSEASDNVPTVIAVLSQQEALARARLKLDRSLTVGSNTSELLQSAESMINESDAAWSQYLSYSAGAEEKALAREVGRTRERLISEGLRPLMDALRRGNGESAARLAYETIPNFYVAFSEKTADLTAFQVRDSAALEARAQSQERNLILAASALLLIALLSAAFGWRQLARAISWPLSNATSYLKAIERGDLTGDIVVSRQDELGALLLALRNMQQGLRTTVTGVTVGAEEVAEVATEMALGNSDLARRTSEQAASLEQTAASMEQLSSTVTQNASNAREASRLANLGSETAGLGADALILLSATMNELKNGSGEIAEITSLIEGIAFQTNILALNAAVEAARAGDQGRGFAVVAGEVRALAQKSGTAAREIKELIDTSLSKVNAGAQQALEARDKMDHTVKAISEVSHLLQEIAHASSEQAQGVEQVTAAVSHMDEVTQRNAALVEKAAAAANSMDERAIKMRTLVGSFRTS